MPFIDISKSVEKRNLRKYLENHPDEANNEEIINFLNDGDDKEDSNEDE